MRRRRQRGHGAFGDFSRKVREKLGYAWDATKERLKPLVKNVAKDTLVPIGKDLLMGRRPTAESIAQNLKNSVKSNVLKEVRSYIPPTFAAGKRIPRRRTGRRRF